ncbi:SpoIID/LytB domain-containing protein [Gordonia sp. (in: high G+C Gram-positive bacteria)]|uniref:SpoIID/LytB domain-containing protein n=1 Tax=Gordonia sp. (in: high G+C Gram-positive bacteria) TaxID=84139 RepID=UPI0016B36489|nr:SpoIID/LytB domain-containing protein [Gordonia sp. (in: high G+C Gram-positive bacteria)]NLG46813.1 stage II sporulation protein SpoIID [Gordonia sp. (in: high G+C Gram-positive bacteria)]
MPNVRPSRAKKRTLTFAALGLAPALLAGGLVVGGTEVFSSDGVTLAASAPITLSGHGHGHGRGMGQWGAYGYAKQGWSADRILKHFYGNTTAGKVSTPEVTVSLSEKSSASVHADAGMRVGNEKVAPGQAVSLSGNTATITSGCGGAVVKTVQANQVDPIADGPNRPANELLTFCSGGDKYRGSITTGSGGVLNKLHVDDYVKGVIPKESVPSWADSGGFEALKAQAVAARSYVVSGLASGRKMDNTQQSQMYHGASGEDPRTSRAADATAGQIRLLNGKPALTEFSASTGGYTAGGLFPAVRDAGDSIAPAHSWSATVSAASIGSAFGVGELKSFDVIEANGLGEGSGRVLKVRVVGSGGTVEATGDEARTKLQLKSDWFAVNGQKSMPKITRPQVGADAPGGGLLDLSPLTSALSEIVPGLSAVGIPDIAGLTGQIGPMIEKLLAEGTRALAAKRVVVEGKPSANSQGSLGTVSDDKPSANSQGSLGTVSDDKPSANSQGSTGTVAKPELLTDGKGMPGLVQVIENGILYFSPATGAHALMGQALTDFLAAGGLQKRGFPTADGLN